MTREEKLSIALFLFAIAFSLACVVSADKINKLTDELNESRATCDSINNNFNIYKSNIEATLDTCFIIGKSSHKIQKYIRE